MHKTIQRISFIVFQISRRPVDQYDDVRILKVLILITHIYVRVQELPSFHLSLELSTTMRRIKTRPGELNF